MVRVADPVLLEQQESAWRLALASAIVRNLPAAGRRADIPASQLALSLCLEAKGKATIAEIRGELGCAQATVTEWVDAAELDGVAERFKDHVDHRKTWVRLTAKGQQERRRTRDRKSG